MAGAWRAAGWLVICLLRPGLGLAGATQHTLTKLTLASSGMMNIMRRDGEQQIDTGTYDTDKLERLRLLGQAHPHARAGT